jgi:hypothetical protein
MRGKAENQARLTRFAKRTGIPVQTLAWAAKEGRPLAGLHVGSDGTVRVNEREFLARYGYADPHGE